MITFKHMVYVLKQAPLSTPGRWTTDDRFLLVRWWRRLWPAGARSATPEPSAGTEPPYWQIPRSATLPCFRRLLPPSCGLSRLVQRPGDKQRINIKPEFFDQGLLATVTRITACNTIGFALSKQCLFNTPGAVIPSFIYIYICSNKQTDWMYVWKLNTKCETLLLNLITYWKYQISCRCHRNLPTANCGCECTNVSAVLTEEFLAWTGWCQISQSTAWNACRQPDKGHWRRDK